MSQEHLKEHILDLSSSNHFSEAIKEWELAGIQYSEEFTTCPCHTKIKERCYISNSINGNSTYVGNVCISRFDNEQLHTGNAFDGLRKIMADDSKMPNIALIGLSARLGYLYDEREYKFLTDNVRKRNLSEKQINWLKKINRRIINKIKTS